MHGYSIKISVLFATILFSSFTWAGDNYPDNSPSDVNLCGFLFIHIANTTSAPCLLTDYKIIGGGIEKRIPKKIEPGMQRKFIMGQSIGAPTGIEVQYNCNGQTISFESQQPFCFLGAGSVTGKVTHADSGIQASYTKKDGSDWDETPGIIHWTIADKN